MWEQVLFEYCEVQIKKRHTSFLYIHTYRYIYIYRRFKFFIPESYIYICTPFFRVYVFILWQNFYYETRVDRRAVVNRVMEKKNWNTKILRSDCSRETSGFVIIFADIEGRRCLFASIPWWMNERDPRQWEKCWTHVVRWIRRRFVTEWPRVPNASIESTVMTWYDSRVREL